MRFTTVNAVLAGLLSIANAVGTDFALDIIAAPDTHWTCANDETNIKFKDCEGVLESLLDLGEDHGGWWTLTNPECDSWKRGNCKATLCPQGDPADSLELYMPDLAQNYFYFLGFVCAATGHGGVIFPGNSTYSLYVSDSDWSIGSG